VAVKLDTHQDWLAAVKPLMRQAPASVPELRILARKVRLIARKSVTPWHEQQTLGMIAAFLADAGEREASARAFAGLARWNHEWLMYYLESSRANLEFAADLYEQIGKLAPARRLRKQAAVLKAFQDAQPRRPTDRRKRGA